MSDNYNTKPALHEDHVTLLKNFETFFLSLVNRYGLPSQDLFIDISERSTVIQNIHSILYQLSDEQKKNLIYLSKFLSAVTIGLFDTALNYLWNGTIQEIRKKVINYDVDYFYDIATDERDQKKSNKTKDITKLDDMKLIQGSKDIGLISEFGFHNLNHIRYMRNCASAAHPNQNQITGWQLVFYLETCIKEVISRPLSDSVTEIKRLLGNIKKNQITPQEAEKIAAFFIHLPQREVNNLASGFYGIYTDESTTDETRRNIFYLLPYLWERVDEDTRQLFGSKYGKYVANNEQPKGSLAKEFLEIVDGFAYYPDDIKAVDIEKSVKDLLSAHQDKSNLSTEPLFAHQLASLIGHTGKLPIKVRQTYVLGLVEVFLTNGSDVEQDAESYYIELINKFSQEEAIIAIFSFTVENIAFQLRSPLCQNKYKELISLIKGKIYSPLVLALLEDIETYDGQLNNMLCNPIMEQKIDSMKKILSLLSNDDVEN